MMGICSRSKRRRLWTMAFMRLRRHGRWPTYILVFVVTVTLFSYFDTGDYPGASLLRGPRYDGREQALPPGKVGAPPADLVQDQAQNVAQPHAPVKGQPMGDNGEDPSHAVGIVPAVAQAAVENFLNPLSNGSDPAVIAAAAPVTPAAPPIGTPEAGESQIDMSNNNIHYLGKVGIDTPQLKELQPDTMVGRVSQDHEGNNGTSDFQFAGIGDQMDLWRFEDEHHVGAENESHGMDPGLTEGPQGSQAGPVPRDQWTRIQSPVVQVPDTDKLPVADTKFYSLSVTNEMLSKFQVALPELLPNYKNPCWMEEYPEGFTYDTSFFNQCHMAPKTKTAKHAAQYRHLEEVMTSRIHQGQRYRLRCFPYFFLLGMGKCGTTDLFDAMRKYVPDMADFFLKEPHFWEWKRCQDKFNCIGSRTSPPSLADYLDAYDGSSEEVRSSTVIKDGIEFHPKIIGDFTPSTLAFHPCWTTEHGNAGLREPQYMNAHVIKSIHPKAKFILIMRDPVERIFSNYRMKDRLTDDPAGLNAETFHIDMLNATETLNNCMKRDTPRACAFSIMRFDFPTHVTNSMYSIFLLDWLTLFPREQFLFIRMEDYMEGRLPHVKHILEFLDMAPLTPEQEQDIANKKVTNQAAKAEMRADTKTLLQDFFRPWNRILADLLQDEGYLWGY